MTYADDEQKEIETEFLRSWDDIEVFFSELPYLMRMLPLIHALRKRGYDRRLRAGQSMITFIISRSYKHGLRDGQPMLTFDITQESGLSAHLVGDHVNVIVVADRPEITPEIENLLIPLLVYPID